MFHTTDRRKFRSTLFLVCGHSDRPMVFDGNQFCYASKRASAKWPAEAYSKETAVFLIECTKAYRANMGFDPGDYKLFPIYICTTV